MGIFLAVLLITWLLAKSVSDGKLDHTYAKQGLVSPRLAAKYGSEPAARDATDGYGLLGYVRAAWLDYWPRRTAALKAARDAKDTDGDGKVSLRERLAAAKAALSGTTAKIAETASAVKRTLVDPVPPKSKPAPQTPEPTPPAVDTGDVPDGTIRYTGNGRERYSAAAGEWLPERVPEPDDHQPRHAAPEPTSNGGSPVTTATGEATNFASAIPELDALTRDVNVQHDQAQAAKRHLEAVDGAVDGFQPRQQRIGQAAASLAEHLQERNVDPAIVQPVLEAAEALSPNDAAALMEHVDAAKAIIDRIITRTEAAQASLAQARQALVGTFADAADVVRERLRGDSRFVADDEGAAMTPPSQYRNDWHPPTPAQDANSPAQRDQRAAEAMRDEPAPGAVGANH